MIDTESISSEIYNEATIGGSMSTKSQFDNKPAVKTDLINVFSGRQLAEIPKLMMEREVPLCVVSGFYSAGFATLCATNERLILIDKKIIRLSYEDIRFETINEINYGHQLIFATLNLYLPARKLQFKSWHRPELRHLSQIVEGKMFERRVALENPNIKSNKRSPDKVKPRQPSLRTYLPNRPKPYNTPTVNWGRRLRSIPSNNNDKIFDAQQHLARVCRALRFIADETYKQLV